MHVLLISECTGPARRKTASVLDRYAARVGSSTWSSPMTEEALGELKKNLAHSAGKKTSVSCFRNEGASGMRLLWSVGRPSERGAYGELPVALRKKPRYVCPEERLVSLLAASAAYAHDWGKASVHFAQKLKKHVPIGDRVRHEVLSLFVSRLVRGGLGWKASWSRLKKMFGRTLEVQFPFTQSPLLSSAADAVDMVVLTHHRLMGPVTASDGTEPDMSRHVFAPSDRRKGDANSLLTPAGSVSPAVLNGHKNCLRRAQKICDELGVEPSHLRGALLVARASMVFADALVSSRKYDGPADRTRCLLANTSDGFANQPLDYHLKEVARVSRQFASAFYSTGLPFLDPSDAPPLSSAPSEERFGWQQEAYTYLSAWAGERRRPALVFNMAGTGTGKTLANLRILAALSGDSGLRVSSALGLRTLTLQTSKAYAKLAGIPPHALSTLVGERPFNFFPSEEEEDLQAVDGSENRSAMTAADFDILGGGWESPPWMPSVSELFGKSSKYNALISSPVLVSTVDFLSAAADPSRQSAHAATLIRLATSDLILDEADAYDPPALVALARLVSMSGMFGRTVVVSSATLPEEQVVLLAAAYDQGRRMSLSAALSGNSSDIHFVSECFKPMSASGKSPEECHREASSLIRKSHAAAPPLRRTRYLDVPRPPRPFRTEAWDSTHAALETAIRRLHSDNCWRDPSGAKRASVGVVGMSNVDTVVEISRRLASSKDMFVCGYHASDLRARRRYKEQVLDRMLSRHGSNPLENFLSNGEVRKILDRPGTKDAIFVIVATTGILNIGRDWCLDWGIQEPSTFASAIQLQGRVNRHRRIPLFKGKTNTAILRSNVRELVRTKRASVFVRPGNEIEPFEDPPKSGTLIHDAKILFSSSSRLYPFVRSSPGLQLPFDKFDRASFAKRTRAPAQWLFFSDRLEFLSAFPYRATPLRDISEKMSCVLTSSGWTLEEMGGKPQDGQLVHIPTREDTGNFWLCPTVDELVKIEPAIPEDEWRFEIAAPSGARGVVLGSRLGASRRPSDS